MNPLPIVTRELTVRARLPQSHWTRMAFAAVAVALSLQFFLLWRGAGLFQVAAYAFQTLSWMAFLLASATFVLTADSLSSERRRGTLGLLLLTRIGILDVLAGKLVSSGLSAVLGLVAVAPALMLPVLVGGVTWRQVVLVALSLPGLMFFSLCAGLWASSNSNRLGRSFLRSAVCVVLFVKVPLILGAALTVMPLESELIQSLSPGGAFLWGAGSLTTFAFSAYWKSIIAGFAWGGLLLLLAGRNLRRNWREEPVSPAAGIRAASARRAPVGDEAPVRWLVKRSGLQASLIWLAVGLLLLPKVASALLPVLQLSNMGVNTAFFFVSSVAAGILFSAASSMFFLEGRRTSALELLRTTPEGHQHIVTDQWHVLRQRLIAPVTVLVVLALTLEVLSWVQFRTFGSSLVYVMPQEFAAVVSEVFDIVALCWLGMWFGLRGRGTWPALLGPVGLVTGLNLLLMLPLWGVLSLFVNRLAYGGLWGGVIISVAVASPWLVLIGKQIWLIRWARRRLHGVLAGAMIEPMELRASVSLNVRRAAVAVRKARHWTPGDPA